MKRGDNDSFGVQVMPSCQDKQCMLTAQEADVSMTKKGTSWASLMDDTK